MSIDDVRKLDGALLLVFRELLRHGSATVAARHLGLTQPAVSHALSRLRAELGDPLFVRRSRGLDPTQRARELAPIVEEIIELAGRLHARHDAFDPATAQRTFRVAAPEFIAATIGGALLAGWAADAPGLGLEVVQLGDAHVVDRLRVGSLDLAVGRLSSPPRGLAGELLYEDEFCVVARRDHPTIGRRLTVAAYVAAAHVLAAGASEVAADDTVDENMRIAAVVPAWLTALSIVATSDAIATCPRRLARQHADGLGLRILPVPGQRYPIPVHLVHRTAPLDPGTAWLADEVRRVSADADRV